MKQVFTICDGERDRILNLHVSATKRQYLSEQVITNYDSKYDYKKEGDKYFFKLKNTEDWKQSTGKGLEAIKTKVFKDATTSTTQPTPTTTSSGEKQSGSPFKNREEGNAFRKWVNDKLPKVAKQLKLDPSGSHNNSYIINAWNHTLKMSSGREMKLGEFYKMFQPKKRDNTKSIEIMPGINRIVKDTINFDNLKIDGTTENFCKTDTKECAQFVNYISDDIDYVGNAWDAYVNTSRLGGTIYSSFKNLNNDIKNQVIKLWQEIDKRTTSSQKWEEKGPKSSDISNIVNSLVPKSYSGPELKAGDIVGIYYRSSENHERAFYEGGKGWFVNGEPGSTIKRGEGWGMNTHLGRVGVVKDGVPLIFHNVDGTTKSDPPQNLKIAWVKRK